MNDIAIVIVTYNSGAEIGECLDAAIVTGSEIIVVDNASSDDTRAEVGKRGVRLIANSDNRGFAAAVNQGFRATTAPNVLLLNPDAVLQSPLTSLVAQCNLPGNGAAGGQTLDSTAKPQAGWMIRRLPTPAALCLEVLGANRLWPRNPVNWRFRCYDLDLSPSTPLTVEQPAGAFFMVRRQVWVDVGGLDERFYPLWFEDVDFCNRILAAGLRIFYVPDAVAKHTGAHSIRKMPLEFREICWYRSLLEYASKHYSSSQRRLVCCSVVAGSVLRLIFHFFHRGGWKDVAIYKKIVGLAWRHFMSRGQGWRPNTRMARSPLPEMSQRDHGE